MTGGRRVARRTVATSVLVVVALLGACGGDDGGDDVGLEDVDAVVELDPCSLLDADTAADLSGGDVEDAEQEVADDGSVSCQFAFADGGAADLAGSSIAASLTFASGSEDDIPGGSLAEALSLGDGGAVEREDKKVRVVYVVETVVVEVEVAPADGEVTDEDAEAVVDFAESTEAPVTEAVTGEPPAPEETTTTEPPTTTEGATDTTAPTVDAEAATLWRLTAVDHRDQIGSTFQFECPGPHPEPANLGAVWGTGTYTDDSSVCVAAVHSGVITLEEGGSVVIEMRPGQDSYPPSEANGVSSREWPEWPGSFAVVDG